MVKNPPSMQEMWIQSLCWEDSLEKRMATHTSSLAWRISWTEEPGRLQSTRSQKSQTHLSDKQQQQQSYQGADVSSRWVLFKSQD